MEFKKVQQSFSSLLKLDLVLSYPLRSTSYYIFSLYSGGESVSSYRSFFLSPQPAHYEKAGADTIGNAEAEALGKYTFVILQPVMIKISQDFNCYRILFINAVHCTFGTHDMNVCIYTRRCVLRKIHQTPFSKRLGD